MDFTEFLIDRLKKKLPGFEAHIKMAPELENKPFRDFKPAADARPSAVLVLLSRDGDNLQLLFTLRSSTLNSHSGQISFPGGRIDEGESPEEAAFREAAEEVALDPAGIRIVGKLSDLFVPPSNSYIIPIVAVSEKMPNVYINSPAEVDEIFFIPIDRFIDAEYFKKEDWNYKELRMKVPFWNVHHSTPLWGATSMILNELITLYREFLSK